MSLDADLCGRTSQLVERFTVELTIPYRTPFTAEAARAFWEVLGCLHFLKRVNPLQHAKPFLRHIAPAEYSCARRVVLEPDEPLSTALDFRELGKDQLCHQQQLCLVFLDATGLPVYPVRHWTVHTRDVGLTAIPGYGRGPGTFVEIAIDGPFSLHENLTRKHLELVNPMLPGRHRRRQRGIAQYSLGKSLMNLIAPVERRAVLVLEIPQQINLLISIRALFGRCQFAERPTKRHFYPNLPKLILPQLMRAKRHERYVIRHLHQLHMG